MKNFLQEKRSEIIEIIIAIAIIIAGVSLYYVYQPDQSANFTGENIQIGQPQQSEKSLTRAEVPKDIVVPEVGQKTSGNIAVPVAVSSAVAGSSSKYRAFNISAKNDLYNPSTVIVKVGDTVHINFTAVDKIYDITFPDYGMKQISDRGQTKILEFQAVSTGKFTYYCTVCGGLTSKTIGYIIVTP